MLPVPPAGNRVHSLVAAPQASSPWPIEFRLIQAENRLEVEFDNGRTFVLPAEYLRVESPSAEVQGHGRSQKTIVPGKRGVAITSLKPVGNYAVRIVFGDGHDTGLYSWTYLYELGEQQDAKWATYLAELEKRGLGRG